MNDREKESRKAVKELNKAALKGIQNLSKENAYIILRLFEIRDAITKIYKYEVLGLDETVKKYKKKLKNYEDVIDKKYWNEDALFYISFSMICNVYKTLDEAIAGYEDYIKTE